MPPDKERIIHDNDWMNPIQQVRAEIYEFTKRLYELNPRHTMIEIGYGRYGGTRYLWQLLFDRVVTIDIDPDVLNRIHHPQRPQDATIISSSLSATPKLEKYLKGDVADAMFIDGGHSYDLVKAELLLYYPFVRKGGIIGFHDTMQTQWLGDFADDLAAGKIDNIKHDVVTFDLAHTACGYGKPDGSPYGIPETKVGLSYIVKRDPVKFF